MGEQENIRKGTSFGKWGEVAGGAQHFSQCKIPRQLTNQTSSGHSILLEVEIQSDKGDGIVNRKVSESR